MLWVPEEHSHAENLQWCGLRAIEWGSWPAFLSASIAPVAIIFIPWFFVFFAAMALNIMWCLTVRYRFVSPAAASWGPLIALLRLVTGPGAAIYLWMHGHRIDSVVAVLWALSGGAIILNIPPTRIGKLQRIFMLKLGYSEKEVEEVWGSAQDLVIARVATQFEKDEK